MRSYGVLAGSFEPSATVFTACLPILAVYGRLIAANIRYLRSTLAAHNGLVGGSNRYFVAALLDAKGGVASPVRANNLKPSQADAEMGAAEM